jgi:cytochrome P450
VSPDDALTTIITGAADFHRNPDSYYRAVGTLPEPVFRLAGGGPWWCTSHAAATEVLTDPTAFRMGSGRLPGPAGMVAALGEHWLELSDGPGHRAARRLVGGMLAGEDLAVAVETALSGLRSPAAGGPTDLVADVIVPFWRRLVPCWLGLPADQLADLEADAAALMAVLMEGGTDEQGRAAAAALHALAGAVVHADHGVAGRLRRRGVRPVQVAAHLVNLLVDMSAVPIGLAVTMARLLDGPVARAALTAPARRPAAVAECLRLDPPQTVLVRTAVEDRDVAGTPVRTGDTMIILVGLANRDPTAFAQPEDFRPERDEAGLAFGLGAHACLGRGLVPRLADAVVAAVLERVPEPVPAGPSGHSDQVGLRNIESLPARSAAAE